MTAKSQTLTSTWFDGETPKGQVVWLCIDGDDLKLRSEEGRELEFPVRKVRWAERTRHGQRQTYLPDGSTIVHPDGPEWDAWRESSGHVDSRVVRMMQSWRGAWAAMAGSVAFLVAAWLWGVPVVSKAMTRWVPPSVESRIGEYSLKQLDALFLEDTTLPEAQQRALRDRFAQVVGQSYKGDHAPPRWELGFYRSEMLGPNAFALPGGHIVITDELISMLEDEPDAVMGVLAHELGHVDHRHGLDLMFRSGMLSALLGLVIGDASTFLTTIPLTLTTQGYSRDAEREADAHAARMLYEAGISPAVMARFFESIQQERDARQAAKAGNKANKAGVSGTDRDQSAEDEGIGDDSDGLSIAISSHPGDQERIRYFREWRPGQADRPAN